jgi:hypothetical protein
MLSPDILLILPVVDTRVLHNCSDLQDGRLIFKSWKRFEPSVYPGEKHIHTLNLFKPK